MKIILKAVKCGFVLDFAHSFVSSKKLKRDYKEFTLEFIKLKPRMFHLADGWVHENVDRHLALGKGNFDLPFFIPLIKNHDVTLEISPVTFQNVQNSVNYLRKFS